MKLSLRKKIFVSFLAVMIITGFFITFVGIKFINKSIMPRIQNHVRLNLNSAHEIYQKTLEEVQNAIRFTSIRFFIKDALLAGDINGLVLKLEDIRKSESLDILNLFDSEGKIIIRTRNQEEIKNSTAPNEIIEKALIEKNVIVSTEIFSKEELLKEGKELTAKAYTRIIPSPHTNSKEKFEETSGMVIIAAAPVISDKGDILGILYGGKLLNHTNSIVDEIRDTIFEREKYKGKEVGVVTIFMKNIRISTNMKMEEGNRAVGTIVSEEVEKYVLENGNTWIERAFVVDDWYITAYEPITNISGENVGILGLGILERKFKDIEKHALLIFLGITFGGIVLSVIIGFFLTNNIMRPINSLLLATQKLANGNLDQQVQLKSAPEEIAVLGKAFNYMVSSISERDKQLQQRAQEEIMKSERLAMVGQLAAGVAHEINNPLGGILLFSRLLLQKAPSEGIMKDNLERIEKDAKRCHNIVQGLQDFARQRDPKSESVDINDLLEKTINLFENQPMFHNIEIIRNYQPDLPLTYADPAQIQQVFVNIIMNAVEAMNGKGRLTLITQSAKIDGYIKISFSDTGSGIPQDQIERIFEPFYTTKGVGHGTGLGLSISYGIIQGHEGTIKVTSTVGKGSAFEVILPITREKD